MRLSDVLSKPPVSRFEQVDNFLGKAKLNRGKQRKVNVGIVGLTYFCKHCDDDVTFVSDNELFCIGINDYRVSIDCVLRCPRCGELVPVWFLVESKENMLGTAPEVRVLKRTERLTENALLRRGEHPKYSEWLEKADRAYRDELGAGSIVYLRKILEAATIQKAESLGIETKKGSGSPKPFKEMLDKVEAADPIIPNEFSENGYKLFGELSDVVHGDYDEQDGLKKYDSLRRLVVGVLDKIKNSREIAGAKTALGWSESREARV